MFSTLKLCVCLLLCLPLFGQVQTINYYSGSNLQYSCEAVSAQPKIATITVSAASNASPVSFTATAHGLDYQSGATVLPTIMITGATGMWTPINGVWTATPTSANAFTIAVDSTTFGALTGTLVVTTFAARTTDTIWRIRKYVYDGSSNLIWAGWAGAAPGATGTALDAPSLAYNKACSSRTTYSYQ